MALLYMRTWNVFSKSMMVGGILDLLIEDDDGIWIADFKTSKNWYREMFHQMAAYHLCIEELGYKKPIAGYKVIHLPKVGDCSVISNENAGLSMEACRAAFKCALIYYRISMGQEYKIKDTRNCY